jgi:hypothetical protein
MTFPSFDTTVPTTSLSGLPAVSLGTALHVTATAHDDRQLDSLDVRTRSGAPGQPLGAWTYPAAWQSVASGPVPVDPASVHRGWTYCYSARARDHAGNVSQWSRSGCTSVALDDRALTHEGHWSRLTGQRFLLGTASRASRWANQLSTPVRADAVWLVVSTCPTCGTIGVLNDHLMWKASLHSAVPHDQVLLQVPGGGRFRGRLHLVPQGSRPVTVDGLVMRGFS